MRAIQRTRSGRLPARTASGGSTKDAGGSLGLRPGCLPAGPFMCPLRPEKQAHGAGADLRLRHTYRSARAARTSAVQLPVAAPISSLLGVGPARRLQASGAPALLILQAKASLKIETEKTLLFDIEQSGRWLAYLHNQVK